MIVTLASNPDGDWEGMYLNGQLVLEGHSLDVDEVLNELQGLTITAVSRVSERDDVTPDPYLDRWGNRLPAKLEELLEYYA